MFRPDPQPHSALPGKAVRWLVKGHPFPTGVVPVEFVQRLASSFKASNGVWMSPGFHLCEFCGKGEFERGLCPVSQACTSPRRILHYIAEHEYQPRKSSSARCSSAPTRTGPNGWRREEHPRWQQTRPVMASTGIAATRNKRTAHVTSPASRGTAPFAAGVNSFVTTRPSSKQTHALPASPPPLVLEVSLPSSTSGRT
jgi:hypothetical protein